MEARFLTIEIHRCDQETSLHECADDAEFAAYLLRYEVTLITASNFIEYEDVDPFDGPLN